MFLFTQSNRQIDTEFLREIIIAGNFRRSIPQELWLVRGLLSFTDLIIVVDNDGQEPSELLFDRKLFGVTKIIRITKPGNEVDIPGVYNFTTNDFTPEILAEKIHEFKKSKEYMLMNV